MAGGPPIRRAGPCFHQPRSGDSKAARAGLAERARDTRIEAVTLDRGQDLAALAGDAAAVGADALGMAGGDGSLAVVAAVAAAHAIPFVCVPAARALDSGQLGIVVLDAPGDSPLPPGRPWSAPRLEVHAPAPVHAGIDGEAVDLDPPLRFASRPASLRVRISPRHPGASPSARLHLPSYPPDLRGGGDG